MPGQSLNAETDTKSQTDGGSAPAIEDSGSTANSVSCTERKPSLQRHGASSELRGGTHLLTAPRTATK